MEKVNDKKENKNSEDLSNDININEFDHIMKKQLKESFFDMKVIPIHKMKLSAPFPTYLAEKEVIRKTHLFLKDYKIKENGIICINQEIVNSQSGVFKEVAMELAKSLFKTGSIISLSLPIRVFEERSMLERYCDWWIHSPNLLKIAGKSKDPLESLKYVICFSLSSLHFSTSQLKPFNPLLGETFQGEFDDGTKIYLEHTSHHPCVSNFYIKDFDNDYSISGYFDMQPEGTMKMLLTNYVYLLHKGKTSVFLKGTNRRIDYQVPKLHFGGIVIGDRITFWEGYMKFEDRSAGLKAIVQFKPKNKGFHEIHGEIFKHDYSKDKSKHFYETSFKNPFPVNKSDVLATISGSYLESIYVDDKLYFDIKESKLNNIKHENKYVLPSDWRYREDIIWLSKAFYLKNKSPELKKKFEAYAQEWKLALEVQQRYDRKIRDKKK